MSVEINCLEDIDFIGGDKYRCRVHGSDIYIDPEFWDDPDDSYDIPRCEYLLEQLNEL